MAGYTRTDTTNNIATGNVINASDLDNEYDAIQAAYNATTGHTHGGAAGEGAPITRVGPVQDVVVSGTAVTPKTDNTMDLGSSSLEFKDLFIDGTANIDSLVADTADINGGTIDGVTIGTNSAVTDLRVDNLRLDGNTISSTDTNGNIVLAPNGTGDVLPGTDDTYDLGSTSAEWKDLWIDGTANIDSLVADTADINGGTVDGAVIGGASAAAGNFTTLGATGVATFSAGTVSAPAITTTGDTNTGIFFPAADTIAFTEGGVESMRIDSTGNLGLGATTITPIASGYTTLQMFGTNGSGIRIGKDSTSTDLLIYQEGSTQTSYYQNNGSGAQIFLNGGSERMRIAANGNVGIGVASVTTKLDILGTQVANRGVLQVIDNTAQAAGTGAGITLGGAFTDAGSVTTAVQIKAAKTNATSNNYSFDMAFLNFANGNANMTENMRITSTGNVGIGTTSPSLLWSGSAKALQIASTSSLAAGVRVSSANASAEFISSGTSALWGLYSSSNAPFVLYTNDSERMRIDSSGNVGIGTSSPSQTLDIRGSTTVGTKIFGIGTNSNAITLVVNSAGNLAGSYNANTAPVQGVLCVGAYTSGDTAYSLVTQGGAILAATVGNVGIGTSSPSTKLTVAGATLINTGGSVPLTIYGTAGSFMSIPWGRNASEARLFTSNSPDQYFAGTSAGDSGIQSLGTAKLYFGTEGAAAAVFMTNNAERMRITSAGNVGIGTNNPTVFASTNLEVNGSGDSSFNLSIGGTHTAYLYTSAAGAILGSRTNIPLVFNTNNAERMRIDSSGNLLVGTTNTNPVGADVNGIAILPSGRTTISRMGGEVFGLNRGTDDGTLMSFAQAGSTEGSISVSGSTVSYNGGHLSRWSQLPDGSKDETILKGTVLTNLDDMCVWEKDGVVAENEQLNKMKVSDVEGDTNVAGVFVNWTMDDAYGVDDMNVAMTGDMIIRIADGVVVQKGDLLMSAGDGTAKPQGDDIVRSKTVAKVTSNYVTCTYADGSYCVPCVLMAC